MMRLPAALLLSLSLLACGGGGDESTGPTGDVPGAAATIRMPGNSFSPAEVTIAPGGTVAFVFPSTPHNAIFKSPRPAGTPADIDVTSNQTVMRTFPTAGTFPYDCTLHAGMVGRVIVR
jgi:plastocyanin